MNENSARNVNSAMKECAQPNDGDTARVTFIMSVFNGESTLGEALASLTHQTLEQWKLVVCDDASTDRTLRILEKFQEDNPGKVMIVKNDVNRKLAASLNYCLNHVHTPYLARMDADDVSLPERLSTQVTFLDRNPEVHLVGSAMQRFDAEALHDVVMLPESPERRSLARSVPFAHATVVARTSVFKALGGYAVLPRTERCEDYDLWFRFFNANYVGRNLQTPLYLVREDSNAIRRRDWRNRWNTFSTKLAGMRLLRLPFADYPWALLELIKIAVPGPAVLVLRRFQARRAGSSTEGSHLGGTEE